MHILISTYAPHTFVYIPGWRTPSIAAINTQWPSLETHKGSSSGASFLFVKGVSCKHICCIQYIVIAVRSRLGPGLTCAGVMHDFGGRENWLGRYSFNPVNVYLTFTADRTFRQWTDRGLCHPIPTVDRGVRLKCGACDKPYPVSSWWPWSSLCQDRQFINAMEVFMCGRKFLLTCMSPNSTKKFAKV